MVAADRDTNQIRKEKKKKRTRRWRWSGAHRDVGVAGVALGVGGGEDGVDEHEGADDLGAEPGAA